MSNSRLRKYLIMHVIFTYFDTSFIKRSTSSAFTLPYDVIAVSSLVPISITIENLRKFYFKLLMTLWPIGLKTPVKFWGNNSILMFILPVISECDIRIFQGYKKQLKILKTENFNIFLLGCLSHFEIYSANCSKIMQGFLLDHNQQECLRG